MNKKILLVLMIAWVVLLFDQFLKLTVFPQSINPGVALGIEISNIFFFISHIIVLVFLLFVVLRSTDLKLRSLILFIIIVSLSNLIDRAYLGGVIDYLQFLGIWFNFADMMILIGILYYSVSLSWRKKQ